MTEQKTSLYIASVKPLEEDALYQRVYELAGERRRRKTDSLRFRTDRNLSLGAAYLLRAACADRGVDYEAQTVLEDENGKPYFKDVPLHFSLSHSGDRVLCAVSSVPVGCDTERVRPVSLKAAERFFSSDEYARLEAQSDEAARQALFFRLWTLKESYMKCTGLGFRLPLNGFSIDIGGRAVRVHRDGDGNGYTFFENSTVDGYCCACCVQSARAEADWHTVTIE